MESLGYRIMPLYEDAFLSDAMVDMQLAGRQQDWHQRQPSPPESVSPGFEEGEVTMSSHSRSKTMINVGSATPL